MDPNDYIRDSDRERLLLHRRQFVLLSSIAVAGAAASGLPQRALRTVAGADPATLPIVSLGYWDGSLDKASLGTAPPDRFHRLASAASARSADRALDGSARININGFWRAAQHRQKPVSIGLNVLFPAGGERLPFHAWSHATSRGVARNAPPPHFVVPVDARHPIELNVEMRMPAGATTPALARVKRFLSLDDRNAQQQKSGTCSLALDSRSSSLKLNRGVYFVALQEDPRDQAPNWASVRMLDPHAPGALDASGPGVLVQGGLVGYEPVPFSYLMISVNKA
ncbi:MAG TPA: hypothetical protein VNN08_12510 [Thermoanaerobaculia bacterium]|nr:hypothetical protein [Thermoanaerobaculia bacterium]